MLSIEKQILFLLSHVRQIETQELLSIYEARGYSGQHIRNTLSRMKKAGHLVSPSRSAYSITDSGTRCLHSINHKGIAARPEWDKLWYTVMLEIPETDRKKRDEFRTELLQLGFGALYNSVYISPWDYSQEVLQLAEEYRLLPNLSILRGVFLTNSITPAKAAEVWRLDKLRQFYHKKEAWFQNEFLPSLAKIEQTASTLDIFVHYLHLGEELSDLFIADPVLPEALLPPDWPGEAIRTKLYKTLEALSSRLPTDSRYSLLIK